MVREMLLVGDDHLTHTAVQLLDELGVLGRGIGGNDECHRIEQCNGDIGDDKEEGYHILSVLLQPFLYLFGCHSGGNYHEYLLLIVERRLDAFEYGFHKPWFYHHIDDVRRFGGYVVVSSDTGTCFCKLVDHLLRGVGDCNVGVLCEISL